MQPRRAVRFQNQKEKDKVGGDTQGREITPQLPPANQKGAVSEVMDEEDVQDTDYDTDDLANLPTDSDTEDVNDDPSGVRSGLRGGPSMTTKAGGGSPGGQ